MKPSEGLQIVWYRVPKVWGWSAAAILTIAAATLAVGYYQSWSSEREVAKRAEDAELRRTVELQKTQLSAASEARDRAQNELRLEAARRADAEALALEAKAAAGRIDEQAPPQTAPPIDRPLSQQPLNVTVLPTPSSTPATSSGAPPATQTSEPVRPQATDVSTRLSVAQLTASTRAAWATATAIVDSGASDGYVRAGGVLRTALTTLSDFGREHGQTTETLALWRDTNGRLDRLIAACVAENQTNRLRKLPEIPCRGPR